MAFFEFMRRRISGTQGLRSSLSDPSRNSVEQALVETVTKKDGHELLLIAYRTKEGGPKLEVAPANRKWMNETSPGFANRCLPLRIANQAGWFLLNHESIEVVWNGQASVNDLTFLSGSLDGQFARSHFGHGILTWQIPYLFRTPTGYNLYVRGPTNWCKDGACPLDAVVETDWPTSTFTMNWKITRVGVPVRFEKDEPICMIFPIARGEIEKFQPEVRRISEDPELERKYKEWKLSRELFNRGSEDSTGSQQTWQKHYYLGTTLDGKEFAEHQVKLKVRTFKTFD